MNDIRNQISKKLLLLGKEIKNLHISELSITKDIEKSLVRNDLINFDYSKQRINDEAIDYLLTIPDLINLKDSLKALFNGEFHNPSENRNVSHTFYRNKASKKSAGQIFTERERVRSFLDKNELNINFKNLICLSIGGSRLGPELLTEFQSIDGPANIYFCSSYDLLELTDVLKKCLFHPNLLKHLRF